MSHAFPPLTRRGFLAGAALWLAAPGLALAADPAQLKAVFLLRFLRYVEFQGTTPESLHVRVVGAADVSAALDVVRAKLAGTQEIHIETLSWEEVAAADITPCDVLYLRGETAVVQLLAEQVPPNTLIVGDSAELIDAGAALGFFWEDDRLRFEASQPNAKSHDVKLGAELLRLARKAR